MTVSARRLLGIVCIATFWITGRFVGEFYPFSPLSMFDNPATAAQRLFVRDASGEAREIGRYDEWQCEGPLDFKAAAESCPDGGFSAYEDIVRDHIDSHPLRDQNAPDREVVQITRRVFRIPDPHGAVQITDCPLLRCTARRLPPSLWMPRL